MPRTPEDIAAQRRLQDALDAYLAVVKPQGRPQAEVLTDWALVACSVSLDDDGDRVNAYDLVFSDAEIDEHRAYGLYMYAAHLITNGRKVDDQD